MTNNTLIDDLSKYIEINEPSVSVRAEVDLCKRAKAELLRTKTPALSPKKQIGGNHYTNHTIQPWDVVDEYHLDYYSGSALTYIMRYKEKGGKEDIEKALHYLEKLLAIM